MAEATTAITVTPSETKASEVQLERVLNHSALIITRPIEWGTVVFGFEQANKYQVFDEQGTLVALIAEDYTGLGNEVGRQLLRTRRSFTATVLSADGSQVIFRVRRPAYLITSTMFIEDGTGEVIGEVHRRWSMLQRNYDLYLEKQQFAAITGNFLAWEFELKDANGGTLGFIDRNFQGFGKEIFTDAGKYVIHFGMPAEQAAEVASNLARLKAPAGQQPAPAVTPMAVARTDVPVIPTATGNQLMVARRLQLTERMITLACAISIDYDFFSQHSHGSGVAGGFMPIPMYMPGGGGAAPSDGGSGAPADAAGAAAGGAAGAAGPSGGPAEQPGQMQGGTGAQSEFGNDEWSQPGSDANWGEPQQGQFGSQDEQEIRWDDGGESGDAAGGEGGGDGSLIGTIWGWVSGGD